MREYQNKQVRVLKKIYCNKCGKEIEVKNEIVKEGIFSVDQEWGFFSEKDGTIHSFDLCETCYDEWISQFELAVTVHNRSELL